MGSARLIEDAITMCRGSAAFSSFGIGCSALGVGRFLSFFTGTSGIPHFGQFPGASVTTSGCIRQVYFCGLVSAKTLSFPANAIAVSANKRNFFILFPDA